MFSRTVRVWLCAALAASALCALVSAGAAQEGYLRFPDIHGNSIVFSCEGDLWTVPARGGTASRLTTAEGMEILPKFAPDGRYIAFTGEIDKCGNDAYLIPAGGGEIKRLTYHPYSEWVMGWSEDGSKVIFRSVRYVPHLYYRLFEVPVEGGFPELIPIGGEVSLYSFAPDGRRVAFNRFSREWRTWKRYVGGRAQDIWVGDLETSEYEKVTDFEGTDAFPMWVGDRIYFVSDRSNTVNIFSMRPDGSDVTQHTFHDEYDIRWPSIGEDRIVYQNGADIWVYDIATGDHSKIPIYVPSDRLETRGRYVDAAAHLTDFDLSPKGRRVVFCSRGNLAVAPVEEGRFVMLPSTSAVRERSPRWSPDGKSISYVSDATGEEEIYLTAWDGMSEPEQLTEGTANWKYPPVWSPDGKKLAYSDGRLGIYIVDRDTGRVTRADGSDYWEITDYSWSPDSRYLAYSKYENWSFESIFIYDADRSRVIRVTDATTDDHEPVWDPDGEYLYFLSDRTIRPMMSQRDFQTSLDKMTKPYLVILKAGEKSPFFTTEPEEREGEPEGGDGGDEEEGEGVTVKIDFEGLAARVVEFPVEAGHYFNLSAVSGKVLYLSGPSLDVSEDEDERTDSAVNDLVVFDMEEEEAKTTVSGINTYRLSADGSKLCYRREGSFALIDAGAESGPNDQAVDLSPWKLRVDPVAEWKQIFNEGWRLQRDFYWAPDMAKVDWEGVKERYSGLLPRVATRADLNDLIGEMIAELSTSHTYIWGGDQSRPRRIQVGLLGADIAPDRGYYRITKIYPSEPWRPGATSPLTLSHAGIGEGEYVIAVNGLEVPASDNFYAHFVNLAGTEVILTVNDRPSRAGARDVMVGTLGTREEDAVRYVDWVRSNREYVDEATGGRVGYIHLPDMGTSGMTEFWRTFYPQLEKPGIIVDARYNGGGFVSQLVIEKLSVNLLAFGQARRGKPYKYPDEAVHAHRVLLTNQSAGSDGDIIVRAFKLAELGPVIGMRTWGGVVGIRSDKPFVDGGMMTIPEFAWWEPEGGWTIENRGAEPDIEVENMPGQILRGRDQQLERAVDVILEMLEQDPKEMPELPPYPDKSKMR
jgi:tricorn protease